MDATLKTLMDLLSIVEENHPLICPNRSTDEMALWVTCFKARQILASNGYNYIDGEWIKSENRSRNGEMSEE